MKFATPDAAPNDCDFVFHTSASAAGLATALDIAADEATMLELSWYGAGKVAVPLGGAFHSRRLKLISSQVGKVAPSHRASVTHRQRLEAAIELLADPRLDALLAPAVKFRRSAGATAEYSRARQRRAMSRIDYLYLESARVCRRSSRPHHDRPLVPRRRVRTRRRRCTARPS